MPTHWTYCDFEPNSDLVQGDILGRNEELVELMRRVHAHFCDEKYLGFVVVTQSCDMYRRQDGCRATHITLAVIRSLEAILARDA